MPSLEIHGRSSRRWNNRGVAEPRSAYSLTLPALWTGLRGRHSPALTRQLAQFIEKRNNLSGQRDMVRLAHLHSASRNLPNRFF